MSQILDQYSTGHQTSTDDWLDDNAIINNPQPPDSELDGEDAHKLHGKLLEWLNVERQRQAPNRYQMALDQDFYDGLQWAEEDIQELVERNQAPLVYNMIKPTIDWVTGTEKRTRVDFKILPREEGEEDTAQTKTKVLKYLSDVNRTGFARSRAFADAVKVGVGWMEDGVRSDNTDEPIFSRYETWRNVIYDSLSVEPDLSDARYLFRWKWIDLDVALAMFPERANQIRSASMNANRYGQELDEEFWYLGQHYRHYDERGQLVGRRVFTSDTVVAFNRRSRVKVYEGWYRRPTLRKIVRGDAFNGRVYDENHPQMRQAVEQGYCSVYDALQMEVRLALFTDGALLQDDTSPYRHNRFPLTPIWCYRRGRDNAPYGIIRNIRDPQEDLNKRMSKAQFVLSSNQVIMEAGAVDDIDELADEVARPNGIIVKNKGKELEIKRDNALAEQHISLAHFDAQKIQDAGGITDEQMGRQTNAQSGIAIQARQLQGSVVTAEVFDNLRMSTQMQGEIQLSLVEQFMATPKQIRLTGNKGKIDWVNINQPKVDEQGNVSFVNDITAREADFVVSEQDFHASARQAMFEELTQLVGKLPPEVGMRLLDLVIDFSDVPNKEEIVARIRKITGEVDPNAKVSPEEQQQIQQAQAQAQAQQQKAEQAYQLDMEEKAARVELTRAQAQKFLADAQAEGGNGEQGAAMNAEIEKIRQEAIDTIAKLQGESDQVKRDAADQITAIQHKHNTTVDAARITAQAHTESSAHAAELKAASDAMKIRADKEAAIELARINAESAAKVAETERAAEASIKATEDKFLAIIDKTTKELEKKIEQANQELAKTKQEAASREKDKPIKEPKAEMPKPAQPINLTVNVDAGAKPVKKSYAIKTDKEGRPIGIDVQHEQDKKG